MSDSEGRTPLHWAIDRGHLNVAKALVDKNADVNAKVNKTQPILSLKYPIISSSFSYWQTLCRTMKAKPLYTTLLCAKEKLSPSFW